MKFKKKTICCFLYFILVFCKISDKYLSIIYFHFYLILNISVFALIFPHTYFFDTHLLCLLIMIKVRLGVGAKLFYIKLRIVFRLGNNRKKKKNQVLLKTKKCFRKSLLFNTWRVFFQTKWMMN